MRSFICLTLGIIFCFIANIALAQSDALVAPLDIVQTGKQLDGIIKELNNNEVSREQTADFLQDLTILQTDLGQAKNHYISEQELVQKKLDALGAEPEKTKPCR